MLTVQGRNINGAGAKVKVGQGPDQLKGVRGIQGRAVDLRGTIMQTQHLNYRFIDQAAAVNIQHHAVLTVKLTDEWD